MHSGFFATSLPIAQDLLSIRTGVANDDIQWMINTFERRLQYRSNFVQLRWVMPQSIVTWITVSIWYQNRAKIEYYIPLLLPVLLYGSIPFLGLVFMAIFCAVAELVRARDLSPFKKAFSLQNILSLVFVGIPLLLYFGGNVFSEKDAWNTLSMQQIGISLYVSFTLGSFGLYTLILWREYHKNALFLSSIALLLLLPFFKMGYSNDLCMGASIPALFVLMICLTEFILSHPRAFRTGAAAVLLFVSALYPMQEMATAVRTNRWGTLDHDVRVESLAEYSDLDSDALSWKYNYYSYDVDTNIFIRYVARKGWND